MPAPSSVKFVSYVLVPSPPSEVSAGFALYVSNVEVAVVNLSNLGVSDVQVKHSPATPSILVGNSPNLVESFSVDKVAQEVVSVNVGYTPETPTSIEPHHLNSVLTVSSETTPASVVDIEILKSPNQPNITEASLFGLITELEEVSVLSSPGSPTNVEILIKPNEVSTVEVWDGRTAPETPSFINILSAPERPSFVGYETLAESISSVFVRVFYTIPNEVLSVTPEIVILSPNQPATVSAILLSEPDTAPAEPFIVTAIVQEESPVIPSLVEVSHSPHSVNSIDVNSGSRAPESVSVEYSPNEISYIFAGISAPAECSEILVEHDPNSVSQLTCIAGDPPRQISNIYIAVTSEGWIADPDFNFPSEFSNDIGAQYIIFLQPYESGWGTGKTYLPGEVWRTTGKSANNSSIRAEDPNYPRDTPYTTELENRQSGNWNWFLLENRGIQWEFAKIGNWVTKENTIFVEADATKIAGYDPVNYAETDFHIKMETTDFVEANGYYRWTGSETGIIWERVANLDFSPSESWMGWIRTITYQSDYIISRYILTWDKSWLVEGNEGATDSKLFTDPAAFHHNDVDDFLELYSTDTLRYIKIHLEEDYFKDGTYSEKQLMLAEELPAATSYPVVGSIIREYEVTGTWGVSSDLPRKTGPVIGYHKVIGGYGEGDRFTFSDFNSYVKNEAPQQGKFAHLNSPYGQADHWKYFEITLLVLGKNWASLLSTHEASHPGLVSNVLSELESSDSSNNFYDVDWIQNNLPGTNDEHTDFHIYWSVEGREGHYPAYASNLWDIYNLIDNEKAQGIHWEIIDPNSIQVRPEIPHSIDIEYPPLQPSSVELLVKPLAPSVVESLTETKQPLSVEAEVTSASPSSVEVDQYLALAYFPDTQLDYFTTTSGDVTIDSNGHLVLGPNSYVDISLNWSYLRTYEIKVKLEGFDISGGFSGMMFPESNMGNDYGFSVYTPTGYKNITIKPNSSSTETFSIITGGNTGDSGTLKISEIKILIKKTPPEAPSIPDIHFFYDQPVKMEMLEYNSTSVVPENSAVYLKIPGVDTWYQQSDENGEITADEFFPDGVMVTPGTKCYIGARPLGLAPWNDDWSDIAFAFYSWEVIGDSSTFHEVVLTSELGSTLNYFNKAGDPTFYSFIMPEQISLSSLRFRARIRTDGYAVPGGY